MHRYFLLLPIFLTSLVQLAEAVFCPGQPLRSHIFQRSIPTSIRLADNECLGRFIIGGWCAWEPLETAHGISACQKGLNIRWRRRLCNCPPPKPLELREAWCQPAKNASSVARLLNEETRLRALRPVIWNDPNLWDLTQPFSRPGSLTNSHLSCLDMHECYYHTGATYKGKVSVTRLGHTCRPWADVKDFLAVYGMSQSDILKFINSKPENYCRNPSASGTQYLYTRLKPWCITANDRNSMEQWDYCEIPRCGAMHYHGTVFFNWLATHDLYSKGLSFTSTSASSSFRMSDFTGDANAEGCFNTCRFRCDRFALLNLRLSPMASTPIFRACQCLSQHDLPDFERHFKANFVDNFTHGMTLNGRHHFNRHYFPTQRSDDALFARFEWQQCILFNSFFRCPFIKEVGTRLIASTFELALPKNCYETDNMLGKPLSPTTVYGVMGDFKLVSLNFDGFFYSSRNPGDRKATLCTHRTRTSPSCPSFDASSLRDPNSYFNNVVDNEYHWIIIDSNRYTHNAVFKIKISGFSIEAYRSMEVLVRSAPLPDWLVEKSFRSSEGRSGRRTEYFKKATKTEQMLWWKCEEFLMENVTDSASSAAAYSVCSPHQRTRWLMLRSRVKIDYLEMKHMMGYTWLQSPELPNIKFDSIELYELGEYRMNCLTMHHPPMGPEYADYWEDLYSFDSNGMPVDPPLFTKTHPLFTLPLTTHDSINSEERYMQEEWDVEACGDWDILQDTSVVGVPARLVVVIDQKLRRGQACATRKEVIGPGNNTRCTRSVYFRVDKDSGEVIHYPDFGRSYDLTKEQAHCQFVCAVSRECKAFEFSQDNFCRLHLITYTLETMFTSEKGTVYGRKSDIMATANPFTWNNPYHPYYRMLQDILTETDFFR